MTLETFLDSPPLTFAYLQMVVGRVNFRWQSMRGSGERPHPSLAASWRVAVWVLRVTLLVKDGW